MSPFINILLIVVLTATLLTYLIHKENSYRKEMAKKLDNIILLLQKEG